MSIIIVFCVTSGTGQENKKAREIGEAELKKYVIECGDNWYVKRIVWGPYELRRNGITNLKEKTLSESDRLNGIEYLGVLEFYYSGPQREYGNISKKTKGWSAWTEANIAIDIWIQKKSGSWKAELTDDMFRGSNYVPIVCNNVPGYMPKEEIEVLDAKPEILVFRYFNAMKTNDNSAMASMALEPLTMDFSSFFVVRVGPEKTEAAVLPELRKQEAYFKKKLEEHVGPTMDAKEALDVAKSELDIARSPAAKQTAQKKKDEMQAKYDQEFGLHKELQKGYNDAGLAAAREEKIAAFSLRAKDLSNIRALSGEVQSKEVDIKIKTRDAGDKSYKLLMRRYILKDEALNLKHNGRWVIAKFEPLA